MIARISNKEDLWLADLGQLDTPEARQEAMKGTVEDWATESLLAAKQAYQVPETGSSAERGATVRSATRVGPNRRWSRLWAWIRCQAGHWPGLTTAAIEPAVAGGQI